MEHTDRHSSRHLAWHETLEIHELVAFQSIGLIKLKKALPEITDPQLKNLYQQTINGISQNIRELLQFYPLAPSPTREEDERHDMMPFFAGDLLALAKTSVRNYSIAITETATPALRRVLTNHLMKAIDTHANAFNFMYEHSYYPSYDFKQLLENDMTLAQRALSM
ncbi:spore coat protein [Desertibacillus haloalkaliphilus]|uniref:spore coat protein n=1 Tax=Desertibacillus haloalkaliphilus TaxID=1328930 RepID=UPI001C2756E2|nr:spore coat protein [Desertibacillus haloalkaliphilus]MBU8907490.1 spore coat protein [Desertibacillus haloalkaliphilus]